jgi:uncharacterized Rossmann fold enzyme
MSDLQSVFTNEKWHLFYDSICKELGIDSKEDEIHVKMIKKTITRGL